MCRKHGISEATFYNWRSKTYREDVLDENLFYSIEQANEVTAKWVVDYNHERPHQSLNYQTPMAYAA